MSLTRRNAQLILLNRYSHTSWDRPNGTILKPFSTPLPFVLTSPAHLVIPSIPPHPHSPDCCPPPISPQHAIWYAHRTQLIQVFRVDSIRLNRLTITYHLERRTTQPENPFSRLVPDQVIAIVPEFTFESGYTIRDVPVAYKTWGLLNEAGDNCMLVCHPLTRSVNVEDWYWTAKNNGGNKTKTFNCDLPSLII